MNRPDPRIVAATLTPAIAKVIAKRALAEVLRERVDAIKQNLLDATVYTGRYTGERVTEPEHDWTMSEEDFARYNAFVDVEVRASGLNPAPGECPALVAEWGLTQAENALIKAAEKFFPELTNERLLLGSKGKGGLETRREYLNTLCGLGVAAMRAA